MTTSYSHEVLGITSPVVDKILKVSEHYLQILSIEKGANRALLNQSHDFIIKNSRQIPVLSPGGPAANSLQATAFLGLKCAIFGKIGKDEMGGGGGGYYKRKIHDKNIDSLLIESLTPTAQVLSLVTPDGERTICPILGAAKEIQSNELTEAMIKDSRLVVIDGYNLYYGDLVEKAVEIAKKYNVKVAFDFSCYELIANYRDRVFGLLKDYIDIVIANEKEAYAFCEKSPEDSCSYLASFTEIAVIMMGSNGCCLQKGENKVLQRPFSKNVLDTTGAGDVFVGGFIYAYLEGFDLVECAKIASLTASESIQVLGAELPPTALANILEKLPFCIQKQKAPPI